MYKYKLNNYKIYVSNVVPNSNLSHTNGLILTSGIYT